MDVHSSHSWTRIKCPSSTRRNHKGTLSTTDTNFAADSRHTLRLKHGNILFQFMGNKHGLRGPPPGRTIPHQSRTVSVCLRGASARRFSVQRDRGVSLFIGAAIALSLSTGRFRSVRLLAYLGAFLLAPCHAPSARPSPLVLTPTGITWWCGSNNSAPTARVVTIAAWFLITTAIPTALQASSSRFVRRTTVSGVLFLTFSQGPSTGPAALILAFAGETRWGRFANATPTFLTVVTVASVTQCAAGGTGYGCARLCQTTDNFLKRRRSIGHDAINTMPQIFDHGFAAIDGPNISQSEPASIPCIRSPVHLVIIGCRGKGGNTGTVDDIFCR